MFTELIGDKVDAYLPKDLQYYVNLLQHLPLAYGSSVGLIVYFGGVTQLPLKLLQ